MALEWVVLSYVAAAEAAMVLLLTLPPALNPLRKGVISVVTRNLLKPLLSVVPFCLFLLLDIYWKFDSGAKCNSQPCTPTELLRHQKSTIKSQRNALLIAAALMLYWMLFAVTRLAAREEQLNERLLRLKNSD